MRTISTSRLRPPVAARRDLRSTICISVIAVLMLGANSISAQPDEPTKERPLDLLENALGNLNSPAPSENASTNDELQNQIDDLREIVKGLQQVLDEKLIAIQQLEDENESLRQALRLRFGGTSGSLPPVPIPNRELIESVLNESAPTPERRETVGPPSDPAAFTVVSEWGRSPEVAASLPGEVSSLIGMTIAVEPGISADALKQLGQELRENYAHYDNINIEVFDDVAAARRFAEKGESENEHRVMRITSFKHSGRNSLEIFRNGKPVIVP